MYNTNRGERMIERVKQAIASGEWDNELMHEIPLSKAIDNRKTNGNNDVLNAFLSELGFEQSFRTELPGKTYSRPAGRCSICGQRVEVKYNPNTNKLWDTVVSGYSNEKRTRRRPCVKLKTSIEIEVPTGELIIGSSIDDLGKLIDLPPFSTNDKSGITKTFEYFANNNIVGAHSMNDTLAVMSSDNTLTIGRHELTNDDSRTYLGDIDNTDKWFTIIDEEVYLHLLTTQYGQQGVEMMNELEYEGVSVEPGVYEVNYRSLHSRLANPIICVELKKIR